MFKLGRKPRGFNQKIPHWSSLKMMKTKATVVSATPSSKFWEAGMNRDFGMMMNGPDPNNLPNYPDGLGDCVCAHIYHMQQIWTYNANPPEDTEPDQMVLDTYEQACGFNPADSSTDQGCQMQTTFQWWMNTGIPFSDGSRNKLFGFIEIDPTNLNDVHDAIYQCGCVGIGLNVPAYLMSGATPSTWGLDPSGDQSIVGGHAVAVPNFYANGQFGIISWGTYYHMTPGFWHTFVDECYAPVSMDWIEKTGVTPLGLTIEQLDAAMSALK